MKLSLLCFLCFSIIQGCDTSPSATAKDYPYHDVGDILFDEKMDSPDFVLCDSTDIDHRRNNLTYPGGKLKMMNACKSRYKYIAEYGVFTGYIVVRFLINCEGRTGRYRSQVMDLDFGPSSCPSALSEHVLGIVQDLDRWDEAHNWSPESDYSKFLNFKIVKGELESAHL